MINWISTTINHEPRKALGLSCDEYALLDLIFKTQTHPNYSDNGWCAHSYATLADVLGIGKGGVFQMVERLNNAELIEVNPANPKQKRATAKFYSIAYVQKLNDEEKAVQKLNDARSEIERNRSESERHIKYNKEKNKVKHTQESKIENPIVWQEGSEERVVRAIEMLRDHLKENPSKWEHLCQEGRAKLDKVQFFDEVKAWIRHNGDHYPVITNPVKSLTSGRSNFISWLRQIKPAKPKTYTSPGDQPVPISPNTRVHKKKPTERWKPTPAEIEELRKTFGA